MFSNMSGTIKNATRNTLTSMYKVDLLLLELKQVRAEVTDDSKCNL